MQLSEQNIIWPRFVAVEFPKTMKNFSPVSVRFVAERDDVLRKSSFQCYLKQFRSVLIRGDFVPLTSSFFRV